MTARLLLSAAMMTLALAAPALAQAPAPAAPAAPAPALTTPADGILARVQGVEIRQADLDAAEEDIGGQATAQMSPSRSATISCPSSST